MIISKKARLGCFEWDFINGYKVKKKCIPTHLSNRYWFACNRTLWSSALSAIFIIFRKAVKE